MRPRAGQRLENLQWFSATIKNISLVLDILMAKMVCKVCIFLLSFSFFKLSSLDWISEHSIYYEIAALSLTIYTNLVLLSPSSKSQYTKFNYAEWCNQSYQIGYWSKTLREFHSTFHRAIIMCCVILLRKTFYL